MKKSLKRVLKIIGILIGIIIFLLLIYQGLFIYKFRNTGCLGTKEGCKPICQRFVEDCQKRVRSDVSMGGGIVIIDNYDGLLKESCPNICIIYTEKNGYFIDIEKQEKYFKDKVKKCKKELKKKQEGGDLKMIISHCNEYGKIETPIN